MIEVAEALERVLEYAQRLPSTRCAVGQAVGRTLAETIVSDIDSPPYDKSLMDGYAVRAADITASGKELTVLEEVTAGQAPQQTVTANTATRIMTGAPMPAGADAVVIVERTELIDDADSSRVRIMDDSVSAGQNIMPQGLSMRQGDGVLSTGHRLTPIDVGLLHEVGRHEVFAFESPSVAVLPTGDELVSAPAMPAIGQIRNSNGPMLCALAASSGGRVVDLGIARDDPDELARRIEQGLQSDILVLSGGVSAGVLDLVPGVLRELGVTEVFHKVKLKPGKPLWFGTRSDGDRTRLVFGLPGNPVSSLVCFEVFVRPAIERLSGCAGDRSTAIEAELENDHQQRGDRPTYFPARLHFDGGRVTVRTLAWQGSADLRTLADANALACFPAGQAQYRAGDTVQTLRLPD